MRSFGRLRVEGVSSSRSRGDEPGARCRDAAVCSCARLSWRLAAQLEADRMRAVGMVFACLEALALPTLRARHGSVEYARWHCDPVKLARHEVGMICTRRMNWLERIDMCTVVPYECMSVSEVRNGLIYLILSSPTHINAIQAIAVAGTGAHFSHWSPYSKSNDYRRN